MSPVSLVYHTEVTVTRLFTDQYNTKGFDMITYVVGSASC